jgi:hypothetical protein
MTLSLDIDHYLEIHPPIYDFLGAEFFLKLRYSRHPKKIHRFDDIADCITTLFADKEASLKEENSKT